MAVPVHVVDHRDALRYEAMVSNELAGFAQYRVEPGRLVFTHTQVDPRFEGQGVGGALASAGLDDVRAQGLLAVPQCPFIARYIERHPAYADLVAPD